MAVHIEQMTSTVHVADTSASPLSPETMRAIVTAVLAELQVRDARAERAQRDRRVGGDRGESGGARCGCGRRT